MPSLRFSLNPALWKKSPDQRGKNAKATLKELQQASSGPGALAALEELAKQIKAARKALEKEDKEDHALLDSLEAEVARLAKKISSPGGGGGSSEEGEEAPDPKYMSSRHVKDMLKVLARKPMAFAFGYDDKGVPALGLHPTRAPKALFKLLKDNGVRDATFGRASDGDGFLRLDVEGKKVPGMRKGVKGYLQDIGSTTYKKVVVLFEGGEDEEDGEEEEEPDVPVGSGGGSGAGGVAGDPSGAPTFDPNAPLVLRASVGAKGRNFPEDVMSVQAALNRAGEKLKVDGKCGTKTVTALYKFQKALELKADGRVDPNSPTFQALKKNAKPKPKSDESESEEPEAEDPGNPQLSAPVDDGTVGTNIPPLQDVIHPPSGGGTPNVVPPPPPKPGKPAPELPPVAGPLKLKKPVGKGGANAKDDVVAAQSALNRNGAKLKIDGLCGPKTMAAIVAYQKGIGFKRPDGLIEPGLYTESWLNGTPMPLPDEPDPQPKPGGKPPPVPPKPPGGPGQEDLAKARRQHVSHTLRQANERIEQTREWPSRIKAAKAKNFLRYAARKPEVDDHSERCELFSYSAREAFPRLEEAGARYEKTGRFEDEEAMQAHRREIDTACAQADAHGQQAEDILTRP
jgi:peptidoglycan hydrolase-like protein with peptidoglycan-binding domain